MHLTFLFSLFSLLSPSPLYFDPSFPFSFFHPSDSSPQVAGGSPARKVSYAYFKAFNQFLGNLNILERIVQATTSSDPERKVTQGEWVWEGEGIVLLFIFLPPFSLSSLPDSPPPLLHLPAPLPPSLPPPPSQCNCSRKHSSMLRLPHVR